MQEINSFEVTYGPLVAVCKAHGISRTNAFKLSNGGMLKTFIYNGRRYVTLQSMRELPQRLGVISGRDCTP